MIQIEDGDKCQYQDCRETAIRVGKGDGNFVAYKMGIKRPELGKFCETHLKIVTDEGGPEYIKDCPNCGCRFGVG